MNDVKEAKSYYALVTKAERRIEKKMKETNGDYSLWEWMEW